MSEQISEGMLKEIEYLWGSPINPNSAVVQLVQGYRALQAENRALTLELDQLREHLKIAKKYIDQDDWDDYDEEVRTTIREGKHLV